MQPSNLFKSVAASSIGPRASGAEFRQLGWFLFIATTESFVFL